MGEVFFDGKHLPLLRLKEEPDIYGKYILKENIPTYPRPELHVSHISHSTDLRAFWSIRRERGFRDPKRQEMVWFSLTVTPDELREAEHRDMVLVHAAGREEEFRFDKKPSEKRPQEDIPPEKRPQEDIPPERRPQEDIPPERRPQEDISEEQLKEELKLDKKRPQAAAEEEFTPKKHRPLEEPRAEEHLKEDLEEDREKNQEKNLEEDQEGSGEPSEKDFLLKFASSPSFRSSSRYGAFRFTFPLRRILDKYSQQFCGGQEPVLRVFCTVTYKQEVMYAVLVHSPTNHEMFSQYPLLEETPHCICAFRAEPEPHFIWRPQAMSETHRFRLVVNEQNKVQTHRVAEQFYVWDHVTLALHVDNKLLRFTDREFQRSISFCEMGRPPASVDRQFPSFEEAQDAVRERWPHHHLQKFQQSRFHITD